MKSLNFIILNVLLVLENSNGSLKDVSDEGDNLIKVSASNASKPMAEIASIFEYCITGEIKKVDDQGFGVQTRFSTREFPLIQDITKLAGAFGAVGTMISFALSPFPVGEAPEVVLLKHEFSYLSQQLDALTNSLDYFKAMKKDTLHSHLYHKAQQNILQIYGQFTSLVFELMNVTCISKSDCRQQKSKTIDTYQIDPDQREEVDLLLSVTTNASSFGKSLMYLISEKYNCYIKKINIFKSSIAALAMKGFSASALYDIATRDEYDKEATVRQFQLLMFEPEEESESVILKCYENINKYINFDIFHLDKMLSESYIRDSNKHILTYLHMKYPWIEFYVITVNVDSKPFIWANDSFHYEMNNKSESTMTDTRSFILIGSTNRVENRTEKEDRFYSEVGSLELLMMFWFDSMYTDGVSGLLSVIQDDKLLQNQFRTLLFITNYSDAVISCVGKNDTIKQFFMKDSDQIRKSDLLIYEKCKDDYTCSAYYQGAAVIATIYSKDRDITTCTKTCGLHGTCFFLPHTKIMACKCDSDYYGDNCSLNIL